MSWQRALDEANFDPFMKGEDVTSFMTTWTDTTGYPLITVERNYHDGSVMFMQVIFLLLIHSTEKKNVAKVITIVTSSFTNYYSFNTTTCFLKKLCVNAKPYFCSIFSCVVKSL